MASRPVPMRRHVRRLSLFALPLALVFALAPLQLLRAQSSVTAQHLTVSLLVPPAQLAPGENFTAGLDFRMEEGWHVYWINAGDSGEPPAARWKLPAGVTADALQFPPPKRLPLGPLMDFGYENEVVFPVPMHVSADFHPASTKTTLGAHVTWLVCREVCIPGKADLAVARTAWSKPAASPDVDPAAQNLIAKFQAQLPQPLPATDTATFSATPNPGSRRHHRHSNNLRAVFPPR